MLLSVVPPGGGGGRASPQVLIAEPWLPAVIPGDTDTQWRRPDDSRWMSAGTPGFRPVVTPGAGAGSGEGNVYTLRMS